MLVLVATNELQGNSPDDYSFTVEGELVTALANECASGEDCGCNRGFPGLASGFATTTAMVADRPGILGSDLRDAVFDWLDRGGWIDLIETAAQERADAFQPPDDVDDLIESIIDEHVDMIRSICTSYPEGTILTRRGSLVMSRSHPTAA